jgi:thiol-disulfide isomerase/thioredoxin
MKKLITLMLALAFGFGLKAQCPYTEAMDFTATDCHGTEVHLFDILDGGQAVLIDFFFTTCGPCQQATPKIVESYYAMGCNMHDVFYMEISTSDGDAACQNWAANYGVEYPTISTNGGGNTICNQYGIQQYPTVILIMPNRQIVIQDLWPINNAQTVITALEQHGLQQHDCNGAIYDPQVTISIDEVTDTSIEATFTPNEDCAVYHYMIGTESDIQEGLISTGLTLSEYIQTNGLSAGDVLTYTITELTPETEYMVYVLPADPDGNLGEVVSEIVTTLVHYEETLTFSTDTIEVNWRELTWITVYNNTAQDAVVDTIISNFLSYTLDGTTFFSMLRPMEFTIPQGESIELGLYCDAITKDEVWEVVTLTGDFPDASFVAWLVSLPWSVEDDAASFTLFPNPANDFVTLKGEDLGTVRIYNALGQKMDEFEVNGSEININTTGYENGVYVVKAGEKTLRFIVRH